eukprot:CAMPEP_0184736774 /NCGR_PEP_ID=MMETSP0314-20130426/62571_1 /TAXON_ID=38298 /ORGANISM="Rhodella maculata, Strain CCMP 736" /LENGTH=105 /DNA_ID=CAMNT_0027203837 /DNA_START=521 /DNA_END=834 /DNA_ORIENTATION=-
MGEEVFLGCETVWNLRGWDWVTVYEVVGCADVLDFFTSITSEKKNKIEQKSGNTLGFSGSRTIRIFGGNGRQKLHVFHRGERRTREPTPRYNSSSNEESGNSPDS